MRFRLRYLKHDLELSPGIFVIGRSAECQLSLDDPLVSRRHALLHVGEDEVFIEDAGSRNGVLVAGKKIEGRVRIGDGDHITIGAQDMTLAGGPELDAPRRTWAHTPAGGGPVTMVSLPIAQRGSPEPVVIVNAPPMEEATIDRPKRGEALRLLGGVADKALALGNPESAERLLQNGLQEILADVRAGKEVAADSIDLAARFASRLASGTGKGSWGDYVIGLYAHRRQLPPATIVDELYVAARKMRGFDLAGLRGYLSEVRALAASFTPTEKFVLQRLEGLERLVASR